MLRCRKLYKFKVDTIGVFVYDYEILNSKLAKVCPNTKETKRFANESKY